MSSMTLRLRTRSKRWNINLLYSGTPLSVSGGIRPGYHIKSYEPGTPKASSSESDSLDNIEYVEDSIQLIIADKTLEGVNAYYSALLRALNAGVMFFDGRGDEPIFLEFKPIDSTTKNYGVIRAYEISSAPPIIGDDTRVAQNVTIKLSRQPWTDIVPVNAAYQKDILWVDSIWPEDTVPPTPRDPEFIYPVEPIGDFMDYEGKYYGTYGVPYAVTGNRYMWSNIRMIYHEYPGAISSRQPISGRGASQEIHLSNPGTFDEPTYFGITDFAYPPAGVVFDLKETSTDPDNPGSAYESTVGYKGYVPTVAFEWYRVGRSLTFNYGQILFPPPQSITISNTLIAQWWNLCRNFLQRDGMNAAIGGSSYHSIISRLPFVAGVERPPTDTFDIEDNWTKATIGNERGYYVAFRSPFQDGAGLTDRPIAWKYKPFTPWRPYIEYNEIGGDLPADVLIKMDQIGGKFKQGLTNKTIRPSGSYDDPTSANVIWVAARSKNMSPRHLSADPQFPAGFYNFSTWGEAHYIEDGSWNYGYVNAPMRSSDPQHDNPAAEDFYGCIPLGGAISHAAAMTELNYDHARDLRNEDGNFGAEVPYTSVIPDVCEHVADIPSYGRNGATFKNLNGWDDLAIWNWEHSELHRSSIGPGYISIPGNAGENQNIVCHSSNLSMLSSTYGGILSGSWNRYASINVVVGSGLYHVFVRYSMLSSHAVSDGKTIDVQMRIVTDPTNEISEVGPGTGNVTARAGGIGGVVRSKPVTVLPPLERGHYPMVADMGIMRFAQTSHFVRRAFVTPISVELKGTNTLALVEMRLHDLILLPVDESVLGMRMTWPPYANTTTDAINGVNFPSIIYDGLVSGEPAAFVVDDENVAGADIQSVVQILTPQKFRVPAASPFRLYFFSYSEFLDVDGNIRRYSWPDTTYSTRLWAARRYISGVSGNID